MHVFGGSRSCCPTTGVVAAVENPLAGHLGVPSEGAVVVVGVEVGVVLLPGDPRIPLAAQRIPGCGLSLDASTCNEASQNQLRDRLRPRPVLTVGTVVIQPSAGCAVGIGDLVGCRRRVYVEGDAF